ncbi:unnamed protein product [Medioppia subpectinata]|uniref:Uncharacterized protein n=1 Tax=Medioppia subpectinata TaxID=1979941 RepID=A0A7R9KZ38_9ACAR|nr:unnamed protein product [Medioppia subpectinata]CAG2112308.1 unnamed protein product [Medioppia subpectinata]
MFHWKILTAYYMDDEPHGRQDLTPTTGPHNNSVTELELPKKSATKPSQQTPSAITIPSSNTGQTSDPKTPVTNDTPKETAPTGEASVVQPSTIEPKLSQPSQPPPMSSLEPVVSGVKVTPTHSDSSVNPETDLLSIKDMDVKDNAKLTQKSITTTELAPVIPMTLEMFTKAENYQKN